MDMNQYLDMFIEESKEHLQNLNKNLLMLEKSPSDMPTLNEIFRSAHTLKGMAGTMGFTKIATLTHDMENVLHTVRNGEIVVTPPMVDLLFKCLDALENYLGDIINTGTQGEKQYDDIISELNNIISSNSETKNETKPKEVIVKKEEIEQEEKKEEKTEIAEETLSSILVDGSLTDVINSISEPKTVQKDIQKNNSNNDAELTTQSVDDGSSKFKIIINLNSGCILKSARSYIIFNTLERNCEIISSIPSIQEIEDEKFDFEFSVIVSTKQNKNFLIKELNLVSEVDKVVIEEIKEPKKVEDKIPVDNQGTSGFEINNKNKEEKIEVQEHESQNINTNSLKQKTGKTVRVDIGRLDNLMNLVSELIIIRTNLDGITSRHELQENNEVIEYFGRITSSLHDAVMKVRMVPVETVFNRFPRMIRDLSKELGKDILLNMYGEQTEVDRTVIDEIGDPLIHLLRNSADHGIESPEKRKALGKQAAGTINLRAYQEGNNVIIVVEDDGQGINIDKVKKKIIEKGLVSEEEANKLTDNEVIDYLFKPSFSTADKITDISGRGVGLDVVKTKIEALGGTVEVETELDKGSKFNIKLPLTLAIIQALLVVVGTEKFALPLGSIKEIINVENDEIKVVDNQEIYILRNQVIPIIRLSEVLEIDSINTNENNISTIVIIKKGEKSIGIIVDSLIGQQEIVIKSLGKYLNNIKLIAGATILGDGQVALILNLNIVA